MLKVLVQVSAFHAEQTSKQTHLSLLPDANLEFQLRLSFNSSLKTQINTKAMKLRPGDYRMGRTMENSQVQSHAKEANIT